jgi:ABC-type transport system involved in cytochrome c biogenesis permease subunit
MMPGEAVGKRTEQLLLAGTALTGLAILWTAWGAALPLGSVLPSSTEAHSTLPDLPVGLWYGLPVQDSRTKPFQSECIETMRQITGRTYFEGHDPVGVVLAWVLTAGKGASPQYTDWETCPFILCEHRELREAVLGRAGRDGRKYVAPADLRNSSGFDALAKRVAEARQAHGTRAHLYLGEVELRCEEVARRLALYDALCGRPSTPLAENALMGEQFIDLRHRAEAQGIAPQELLQRLEPRQQAIDALVAARGLPPMEALPLLAQRARKHPDPLHIVGLGNSAGSSWFSCSELLVLQAALGPQHRANTTAFSVEAIDRVLDDFAAVQAAYCSADAAKFDVASEKFFHTLRETTDAANDGTAVPYPGSRTLDLELLFNRLQPFRWAWVLMFAATVAFLVSLNVPGRAAYIAGFVFALASLAVQVFGFTARVMISGWAPVGNMYETVIFAAFMAACFAVILELIYRRKVFGLAGAGVATLGLLLADQMPLALDPKISPLVPVLRTNYWLTIHVLTIVCGYGGGTLAWGLGNLSLALLAFGRGKPEGLRMLAQLTYRSMQLTVVLLATGTFLGGWWAAHAWGRFWGWDPKEVGALVALVCYVVPLHARYVGWVKDYGLAVAAVVCYGAIILSWYVLNFVLAAGMHSYGFGAGGGALVLLATLLNLEWLLVASLLYRRRLHTAPALEAQHGAAEGLP